MRANPEKTLVANLAGRRVLVVGDMTLDAYLYGRATRLSREAPVPVLERTGHENIPGAAANPARNIAALGSHAVLVGVVGDDTAGEQLRAACMDNGLSTEGLIAVAGRPTTTKTRIMAHEKPRLPQQVARLDCVDRSPLAPSDEQRILTMLAAHIPHVDAVLCSDYQLGLLSPTVVDTARTLCQQHGVLLTVDTQGSASLYYDVDLFRCNNVEAAAALGSPLREESDFHAGLARLRSRLRAKLVIVTRGPDGLSLLGKGVGYTHLPAVNVSEVYDTTGAGDTFIAVATLAMVAGLEPLAVAHLANTAAALTVRKFGNAVVAPAELAQAML
jgi:D-glycero-beta-D-manno-heptose-7-phosphate kinase